MDPNGSEQENDCAFHSNVMRHPGLSVGDREAVHALDPHFFVAFVGELPRIEFLQSMLVKRDATALRRNVFCLKNSWKAACMKCLIATLKL